MRLRVMSFNVRCRTADDGVNSWPFRKDAAAGRIAGFCPDIAGLQEAYDDQNRDLLDRLPGYEKLGVGREDGVAEGEHSTILYRSHQLVPLEKGDFWFSETPEVPASLGWGARVTRICSWATFQSEGQKFGFYNLHLDHESQLARENGVRMLVDRLPKGLPCLVTGDFNADESNAAVHLMRESGLRDTYRVCHPEAPEPGTYTGFSENAEPGKIDYIWCTHHWQVEEAGILRDWHDGRPPSDHHAVTAVVSLPPID